MKHKYFSITTRNVSVLADFYKTVLWIDSIGMSDLENYVELNIDSFVVCIESIASVEKRSRSSFVAGAILIEFEVSAVDVEYARLKEIGIEPLSEPFDNPWGDEDFYFHDPDGNLICFYTNGKDNIF